MFAFAIFVFSAQQKVREETTKNIEENLSKFPELKFVKKFEGNQKEFLLCIDETNKKVVYFDRFKTTSIPFKDIIGVEILEDGTVISKKSASRTVGGAIVGGVLAGGVGSVVGGLSGSSTQKTKISKIVVKVLLRNISNPSLEMVCHKNLPLDSNSFTYKSLRKNADNIKDVISVIIDLKRR